MRAVAQPGVVITGIGVVSPFGVGRELCVNAFGHRGDPRIELFLGDIRLPLVRLNEPCDCSLCRAGLTR